MILLVQISWFFYCTSKIRSQSGFINMSTILLKSVSLDSTDLLHMNYIIFSELERIWKCPCVPLHCRLSILCSSSRLNASFLKSRWEFCSEYSYTLLFFVENTSCFFFPQLYLLFMFIVVFWYHGMLRALFSFASGYLLLLPGSYYWSPQLCTST